MKEYYLIGEVAKIFNISTDTLRYYDKIGLLKAEKNMENNYRYYSVQQFDLLYMILLLKQLDVPLEDIKNTLYEKNTLKIIDLLEQQEKNIEDKIKHLEALENNVTNLKYKIMHLEKYENNISIKTHPEMWGIMVGWHVLEGDFDYNKISGMDKSHNNDGTNVSRFALQIKKESFWGEEPKYRYGVISEFENSFKGKCVEHFPKRKCAFSIFRGNYDHIYSKYLNMLGWIYENGFEVVGDSIEKSIISLCDKEYENEYIAEIWIPIE